MQFTPKSEREIRDAMVLPAGEYDFEVIDAVDKESKAGNEMIELLIGVFAPDGTQRKVLDWLLPNFELKLNRFCHATGLVDIYNAGELNAYACKGVAGRAKIGVEETDRYGKQNRVRDYVVPSQNESTEAKAVTPDDYSQQLAQKDDGIPF